MLECTIHDLKINNDLAQWTVIVKTNIGSGLVKLGSSAIEKEKLINFYEQYKISLPKDGEITKGRVLLDGENFVGLVDKNDCIITPNALNSNVLNSKVR